PKQKHVVRLLRSDFRLLPQLHLEYLPGGSLEDHSSISVDESAQILRQCLSALVYLHGHDEPIVHRDIKPGNILVQSRDAGNIHVKLTDFGITRESHDLTTICGTPDYLAPEVYEESDRREASRSEKGSYTPVVDIWSLGVSV